MKVEFFSADCKLCNRTLIMLEHYFPQVQFIVHKASECTDGSCCRLSEQYGVKAVPSVVVDGKVVLVGLPDKNDIEQLKRVFSES